MTPDESLLERITAMGDYEQVRMLEDGTIIGLRRLMFTVALFVDMDMSGFARRYCFNDRELAQRAYDTLQNGDDEPVGWIARRPEPEGFYDLEKKP